MKVVRLHHHNQLFFELQKTPEGVAELMEMTEEHNKWLAKLKEEGKFIEGYFMPGDASSVLIFEAQDEHDIEMFRLSDPLEKTFEMKMQVALTLDQHLKAAMEKTNW